MAFKMKGFPMMATSAFKQNGDDKPKKTKAKEKEKEKYYTYETTMYDKAGNVIKGVAEEFTGKVKKDETGREYSDVEPGGKVSRVYWEKPKKK